MAPPTSGILSSFSKVQCASVALAVSRPHVPKASNEGGRPPYPLATILLIHFLPWWSLLSDRAMIEALIEVLTMHNVGIMRRLAGIDPVTDRIPGETTILIFRHLLEKHGQGKQIY